MKKFLIILISLILILTGCSDNAENTRKPDIRLAPDISGPIPTVSDDISKEPITIQYIPMSNSFGGEVDKEYMTRWLEYIRVNFNIDLQIPLSIDRFDGYNGLGQADFLSKNLAHGLIGFPATADDKLYELADKGAVMPLTDILEKNDAWNKLPANMKSLYVYQGDIWAIPTGYSKSYYVRTVEREYLTKFNMEIPETFEELRELFARLTKDDPDDDGMDNTIGAFVNPWYVIDIFNNMNCFIQNADNRIQVTSIAFDKNAGEFRDCMFSDNIKQPLNYIKGMIDEGIVSLNRPVGVTAMTYGYYTTYEPFGKELIWGYGGNNNNPIAVNFDENFIAAATGMENAEEAVDIFLDVFYGNLEAYLCAQYGLPGEAINNGSKVEVMQNDIAANYMPHIIGYNPMFEEMIEYTENEEPWLKRFGYEEAAELSLRDDAFVMPNDIIIAIKERVEYRMRRSINGREVYGDELLGLFDYYYKQIMNGFMTVDEGLAAYRARATELGVDEYIAELNSKYIN